MLVPDHNQVDQAIARHEVNIGQEGLEVHLAPSGSEKVQFDSMMKKATEWAGEVNKSCLSCFAADIGLKTTIMKSLGYPLAAVCLSESQCDKIMQPVLKAALPKMGINRNTTRVYIYGPTKYQGLEIPNLYTDLGVARLQLLLIHGNCSTQLGRSLTTIIEGHQLECGSLKSILCLDYRKYGMLVEDSLIKHAWELLLKSDLMIETNHAIPNLLRKNDSSIMDTIIEVYLNAITIADLTEGNGQQVTQEAIEGRKDEFRKSKYKWPYLPRPLKLAWNKWHGALDIAYLRPDTRFL